MTKPPVKTKAGQVITPMERGDAFQTTKQDQKKERSKKKTALKKPVGDVSTADVINL